MRHDNDVTDHTCAFYSKNETKLSWPIGQGVVYDKNDIDKDVTNRRGVVYTKNETELLEPIG